MALKRPYFVGFDGTGDIPVPNQLDDAANARFIPNQAANQRAILGQDGNVYMVADKTVAPRGQKNIIWSSEGYTSIGNNLANSASPAAVPNNSAVNAVTISALTAAQKKATGSTGSATTGNIGTLLGTTPPALDFSPYRQIVALFNLVSFTGGASPTIQFEIDMLDDAATPNSIAIFKSAALSAAATIMVAIGPQQPFMQDATTAPVTTMGANWPAINNTMPTGLTTYYAIPLELLPQGQIQWTVANTPTAINWTCFLYGKY